jgi:hypothetical protein
MGKWAVREKKDIRFFFGALMVGESQKKKTLIINFDLTLLFF